MVIRSAIQKEEITTMPPAAFPGTIHVVESTAEAESAIRFLSQQPHVGFDSESRPSFCKGKRNKVSLIQISTREECFLFRLNKIENLTPLIGFLENPEVKKIGVSLHDDILVLQRIFKFKPEKWIDLQKYATNFGITDQSLQKIYAILFGQKISKSQRLTNWEAVELTQAQQLYAATDAWCCLNIYELLSELCHTGAYELKEVIINKEKKDTIES